MMKNEKMSELKTYELCVKKPYSCGVVLVFLVLAGNSFWCYVRVMLLCQFLVLAGNRQFFCCGGKVY